MQRLGENGWKSHKSELFCGLLKFWMRELLSRLREDELTNDVFGVWFTFVCCAVNKQSWSKKAQLIWFNVSRTVFLHLLFLLSFYWKDTATKIHRTLRYGFDHECKKAMLVAQKG